MICKNNAKKYYYSKPQTTRIISLFLFLFLFLCGICFPLQITFAEKMSLDRTADCWLPGIKNDNIERAKGYEQKYGIFDKNALEVAFGHLRNYCTNTVGGAESKYLFDHLVDIGFRKLDAYSDEALRYGQSADSEGKKRTKNIEDYTNPTILSTPETIINTFVEFRGDNPKMIVDINKASCNIENYASLNLYKRYLATCESARCIVSKSTIKIGENTTDTSAGLVESNMCDTIVGLRRNNELDFVRQLTTRAALRTTNTLFTSYANTYFKSRRTELYENLQMFDQGLTFINRKIQEGTANCSK